METVNPVHVFVLCICDVPIQLEPRQNQTGVNKSLKSLCQYQQCVGH